MIVAFPMGISLFFIPFRDCLTYTTIERVNFFLYKIILKFVVLLLVTFCVSGILIGYNIID